MRSERGHRCVNCVPGESERSLIGGGGGAARRAAAARAPIHENERHEAGESAQLFAGRRRLIGCYVSPRLAADARRRAAAPATRNLSLSPKS
ncbi:hypothetical protein EVAR_4962_1 [Eumeta japonica]|uniref:Uncharacterized protein n=1 Tax=Eumeta variegata TaxID=151549 RepID=A0A4C1V0E3_EUMVA|nr:hypothetical protein EVAR_4962_1 [Eumeta japonica]